MAEQNTGWRDISTVPYDEVVLFYTHDGNIVQDFMYDCGTKQMAGVYTHWQPLLPPPGEEGDSELTIRSISGGECIAGYAVVRGDELVDTFDSRKDAELVVRVGGDKDVVRLVERRDALQARCYKLEAAARRILEWDADPIRDALFDGRGHPSRGRWGEDFEALRSVVDGVEQ